MSLPPKAAFESKVNIQARTDVGRSRAHNEDNFVVCPDLSEKRWCLSDDPAILSSKGSLLVVADGMGGANAGEVASSIAIETIQQKFDSLEIEEGIEDSEINDYLFQAIIEAHKAIVAASIDKPEHEGMGTTIVVAWVFSHKAFIGWVGDSRAYLYNKRNGLKLLTSDHSLVWELVEAGKLTPDEADVHPNSNIITQSLGDPDRLPQPGFTTCTLSPGDRLLLCSDGLNNMVNHKGIQKIVGGNAPLAEACEQLIQSANSAGGADNITVLCLEVLKNPSKKKSFNLFGIFSGFVCCCFFASLML